MQNAILAQRIKNRCIELGISLNTLIQTCELSKSFIYDLEKRSSSPSCDKIQKIANYLDVTTDYLLGMVDSPYCILVDQRQCETYAIDVGKLFQQDDIVRRYASRLFEAYNDIYNANTLLEDLLNTKNVLPKNTNHTYIALKYIIIILSETLMLLKTTNKTKAYKSAISKLTNNKNVKMQYDLLLSSFNNEAENGSSQKSKVEFLIALRNLIAHYDHEKNDNYSNIVNSIHYCNFKEERNCLLYQHDFLVSQVFISLYKTEYKSDEAEEVICEHIISICAEILKLVSNCLTGMLNEFFNAYDLVNYAIPTPESDKIKNKTSTNVPMYDNHCAVKNSNNTISGDNNIIGNGNIVNTGRAVAEKSSEAENVLVDLFRGLDVIKQAQLLTYAAELSKE